MKKLMLLAAAYAALASSTFAADAVKARITDAPKSCSVAAEPTCEAFHPPVTCATPCPEPSCSTEFVIQPEECCGEWNYPVANFLKRELIVRPAVGVQALHVALEGRRVAAKECALEKAVCKANKAACNAASKAAELGGDANACLVRDLVKAQAAAADAQTKVQIKEAELNCDRADLNCRKARLETNKALLKEPIQACR